MSLISDGFASWRECREEYEVALETAYMRAEEATRGALLNDRGRRAGIDSLSLFMGTERRALAYASPELVEHWLTHPRVTFAEFEKQWARDREAEALGAAA